MAKPLNYDALLQHWLMENQYEAVEDRKGRKYSLADLARDFGVALRGLKVRSRADRWPEQLRSYLEKRRDTMMRIVATHAGFDEAEIRSRHARIARHALAKAAARLNEVKPEDLTISAAIALMRLGFEHERTAVGIDKGRLFQGGGLEPAVAELLEEERDFKRAARQLADAISAHRVSLVIDKGDAPVVIDNAPDPVE